MDKELKISHNTRFVVDAIKTSSALFHGDCRTLLHSIPDNSVDLIITSPPYCLGKEYENTKNIDDFIKLHQEIFPEIERILKNGGNLCWQIGNHIKNNYITPLDYIIYSELAKFSSLSFKNRIIWTFGHGLHCSNRFSGRYETIMWYAKGDKYTFNLDAVRVPQKYPGKTYSKGPRKGQPSSNPLGKNPGDVWDMPNVKSNHVEKTIHPCQFPIGLPQRLIRALSNENDLIFDPFLGSGSTAIAALLENRRYLGAEIFDDYIKIARDRLVAAFNGSLRIRPWDKSVEPPNKNYKVARPPE